jgi:tetratricopeptide (TPR) repeat protein
MKNPRSRVWAAIIVIGLSVCAAMGQAGTSTTGSIRGRVVLPNDGPVFESVSIRLESLRGVRSTGFTDNQGNFSFRALPVGIYEVVVEADRNHFDPVSTKVEVFPNSPSIMTIVLKLKKEAVKEKTGSSTISTGELDPNIPPAAKKEFELGAAAAREKNSAKAIAHLQKAVAIYPRYLKAYNDLGAHQLVSGLLDEAAESLARAIEIDPKAFNPRLNLGMVLVQQHRFEEASAELSTAVSLESNSASARLYYGRALVGLNNLDAAEKELKTAYDIGGAEYALALYHLGQLYMGKGERDAAVKTFETYLIAAPSATNAPEVKKMLAMLKQ